MFPLRGAENDIQNHLLFFIFLGKVPPAAPAAGGFCFCFVWFYGGGFRCSATLRRFTRFNIILFLCVPFGDPKGTEKVPATSDSARLAAHNERCHPAKLARSCASKPHWGFDCFATALQPGLRNVGLAAARRRFLCKGLRSR